MILSLDLKSDIPIYQQIYDQILQGIASGALEPGEKLPTVRALAGETGVNFMTVNKAYQLLKADGYIFTDRRNGATVSDSFPGADCLSDVDEQQLSMIISRASLSGIGKGRFLKLCADMYDRLSSGEGSE